MEMVTFPWGDRSRPLAKRTEVLCNLMREHGLPLDEIFADAKTRAKRKNIGTVQRDMLASCGCYNASPWPCSHLYCSCVALSSKNHTMEHRRAYFTAALVRLFQEMPETTTAEFDALFLEAKSAALIRRTKERWFERDDSIS